MKWRSGVLLSLFLTLIGPALWSAAGQSDRSSQEGSEIKMRVDLVLVDAQVMQQKTGRIVGNLKKEDFNLYEAAQYMRKAGNPGGRRVIIVITGITKSIDCSGPSGEEARMALLESGSVVCALIPNTAEQRVESRLESGIATTAGIFKVHTTS